MDGARVLMGLKFHTEWGARSNVAGGRDAWGWGRLVDKERMRMDSIAVVIPATDGDGRPLIEPIEGEAIGGGVDGVVMLARGRVERAVMRWVEDHAEEMLR